MKEVSERYRRKRKELNRPVFLVERPMYQEVYGYLAEVIRAEGIKKEKNCYVAIRTKGWYAEEDFVVKKKVLR